MKSKIQKINELFESIKTREYPYADRSHHGFMSSDCYRWDKIKEKIIEIIESK